MELWRTWIINRRNYRQDLFINEGAHASFENCLFEACEKSEWVLEGFCVMTNHFHLVVRTPQGRKQYGKYLKWLVYDDAARKEMACGKMCRGWALDTKNFKKALLKELEDAKEEDEKADCSDAVARYYGDTG